MSKVKVAVVYHSITGTTEQLARAIFEGAELDGKAEAELFTIQGEDIHYGRFTNTSFMDRLNLADAIVFGSPTFMGTVSAQFKAFADSTSEIWSAKRWIDKVAGGFTTGVNFSGDQLHTIQYLQVLSGQHGMVWVGLDLQGGNVEGLNRLGAQSGLITCTDNDQIIESDLITAKRYGQRIVDVTTKLL